MSIELNGITDMQPNIAVVANLIGDNARAKMLTALLGGKALTATELALEADIMPPTASSHLAKMLSGDLVCVRKQGRHKYFQLKDHAVAALLEQLLSISAASMPTVVTGPADSGLRQARVCYDHLAGETAVMLYDSLLVQQLITEQRHDPALTVKGESFFQQIGADLPRLNATKRPLCKSCLDWSERRSHLAGALGQWILADVFSKNWASREPDSRAIRFTAKGLAAFRRCYFP
ncbi:helix-turn-helix transcriptional regulator [Rheinheimera sp.]|uniref:ArsR/SmtB family transcription factor n=1 Tax=Rheinheimera sp. TaxID=1869214 RepID=UPI0027361497|nr:helix-turn-helix domain-containing protein [Rheinheimera sp.]MDP2715773.1 helix-turn-helix domain-containing protein [Rheinheimera sp.]